MRPPRLITPPAEAPVTLEEFKQHTRVGFTDDDAELQSALDHATEYLDGWDGVLGRCLVAQTWEVGFDNWSPTFRLPFPDVSSVAVTYRDVDDVEQTVAAADYALVDTYVGPEVRFWSTFSGPTLRDYRHDRIKITFTAGYGGAADVPGPVKRIIMLLADHYYENRSAVTAEPMHTVPQGINSLIAPHRRLSV